jgi:DNA-binding beta-propeller fold protein YncE
MIGKIPMPKGTQGISASPDGKRVLAMDLVEPRIAVIDTATDAVVDEIFLEGNTKGAWRARYSPSGALIVAMNATERVANILPANDTHAKQVVLKVGSQPFGVAFNADSSKALIPNHGDGTVTVIDLKAERVVDTFKAGTGIETLSYY